jgi:hypothetical protein
MVLGERAKNRDGEREIFSSRKQRFSGGTVKLLCVAIRQPLDTRLPWRVDVFQAQNASAPREKLPVVNRTAYVFMRLFYVI